MVRLFITWFEKTFKINILGAYDPGYRKVLRTTYPLAAHVLDLVMEKEEDTVLREEEISQQAATIRDELKKTSETAWASGENQFYWIEILLFLFR